MLKLKKYFEIKWLILAVSLTATVILFTHIPQKLMSPQLQKGNFDKFFHVLAYGAITFLFILSVKSTSYKRLVLFVLITLFTVCIVDEITQSLVGRHTSYTDLLADIIGIVIVLLLSIIGKHQLDKIKTGPASGLCYTAIAAFIAGVLVVPVTSITLSILTGPNLYQQQQAARYFFYTTIFELFKGDYDPEEGSVSEDALETFEEYMTRIGDKCSLVICNDPYNQSKQMTGYFSGAAIFSSGEYFSVVIVRTGKRFVLEKFEVRDWELIWKEILNDTERYYRLGYSPIYYEQ